MALSRRLKHGEVATSFGAETEIIADDQVFDLQAADQQMLDKLFRFAAARRALKWLTQVSAIPHGDQFQFSRRSTNRAGASGEFKGGAGSNVRRPVSVGPVLPLISAFATAHDAQDAPHRNCQWSVQSGREPAVKSRGKNEHCEGVWETEKA